MEKKSSWQVNMENFVKDCEKYLKIREVDSSEDFLSSTYLKQLKK